MMRHNSSLLRGSLQVNLPYFIAPCTWEGEGVSSTHIALHLLDMKEALLTFGLRKGTAKKVFWNRCPVQHNLQPFFLQKQCLWMLIWYRTKVVRTIKKARSGKGWWNNMSAFGRGRGKGRGNFKGKSNGKHKGKLKGDKGKCGDGSFICGSHEHWSKECPRKGGNGNNVLYDWYRGWKMWSFLANWLLMMWCWSQLHRSKNFEQLQSFWELVQLVGRRECMNGYVHVIFWLCEEDPLKLQNKNLTKAKLSPRKAMHRRGTLLSRKEAHDVHFVQLESREWIVNMRQQLTRFKTVSILWFNWTLCLPQLATQFCFYWIHGRFCFATSTKRKSAKTVAESLSEFLGMLGLVISARWKSLLTMNVWLFLASSKTKCWGHDLDWETIIQESFDKGRTAMAARCIQTVRAKARTLVNFAWCFRYRRHVLMVVEFICGLCFTVPGCLAYRFHVHSALGCTPFQSLLGKPCKGRVAKFGHDMSCMALHNEQASTRRNGQKAFALVRIQLTKISWLMKTTKFRNHEQLGQLGCSGVEMVGSTWLLHQVSCWQLLHRRKLNIHMCPLVSYMTEDDECWNSIAFACCESKKERFSCWWKSTAQTRIWCSVTWINRIWLLFLSVLEFFLEEAKAKWKRRWKKMHKQKSPNEPSCNRILKNILCQWILQMSEQRRRVEVGCDLAQNLLVKSGVGVNMEELM